MKNILHFFRATAIGGILFPVPVIVLTIVIGKAFTIARMIGRPLAEHMPGKGE